ncbi:Acyl-CoA dehydrogenase apdG, partial [Hondaea fermentalgiana]
RRVARAEVAKHATADDAWVIVGDDVFDVSKFIALHPGGKQILARAAGTDVTEDFRLFHHEGVLRKYGDRLRVAKLDEAPEKKSVVPYSEPIWTLRFNSPYYKDTHRAFRARVRDFVDTVLLPTMEDWEMDKRPPAFVTEEMGRRGLLALMTGMDKFPRAYVDAGTPEVEDFDHFHEFILYDELARCANGSVLAAITNGPAIALSAIMAYGTEEQRQMVAPDVLMGRKFIALGMSEPNAGSDVAALQTAAVFEDDGRTIRINGV